MMADLTDVKEGHTLQDEMMSINQPEQESGTTDGKNFRRATGDYYHPAQWSMTTITNSRQVVVNPEPEHRKREQNAPAFLKPTIRDHCLPGLLTIYSHIPMAREALLARDHLLKDYGRSEDWWNGEPIKSEQVIVVDDGDHMMESQPPAPIITETQRLMAFLELTNRAYGDAGVLGEYSEGSNSDLRASDDSVEGYFIRKWQEDMATISPEYPLLHIWNTKSITQDPGNTEDDKREIQEFRVVRAYSNPNASIIDLYALLDDGVWSYWVSEASHECFLQLGDIFTIQLEQHPSLPKDETSPVVHFPAEWYADRYLEENVGRAHEMLTRQAEIKSKIKEVDLKQTSFRQTAVKSESSTFVGAKELLQVVKPFFSGETFLNEDGEKTDDPVITGQKYHSLEDYKEIGERLQEIAERVMAKHQGKSFPLST
jgi:hypothetical protein